MAEERTSDREGRDDRLRFITDSLPVLISYVDREGRYKFVNRAYERWFGVEASELIGRRVEEMAGEEAYLRARPHIERVMAGEPVRWDALLNFKGIGPRSVEVHYVPERDEEGSVIGFLAMVQDVTPRREAERALRESEERFRTLADHISQLAWIADASGWIFWYNARWFEYTGTDLEEMQGWGWQKVHHPDHVERVVTRFRSHIERGEEWEDIFPLRCHDGTWGWFLSRAMPIRDEGGRVIRWFGTNTDITQRKEMEEALREADQRKDEFLATLAHELRNPLAPIRSGIEVLREASDPDERERMLDVMERQTVQLVRLVDDLMDVSRITRGKIDLRIESVSIQQVVRDALDETEEMIREAGHELVLELPEEPLMIEADEVRLSQVVANLLSNAVRYTPESGTIRLRAAHRDGEIELSVADTGVGIPASLRETIFEMFHQIDQPRDQRRGGLGIGLTLARSLVAMHGGEIQLEEAERGRGSVFTVTLPVAHSGNGIKGQSSPLDQKPAERTKPPARRVLVADDNEDAALLVSRLLQNLGHEVRTVFSGTEALDVGAQARPEVVILDVGMPGMSGLEAAAEIRKSDWGRSVLLVALTGWGQEEDRRRTREAGFDQHLVKPVGVAELRAIFD